MQRCTFKVYKQVILSNANICISVLFRKTVETFYKIDKFHSSVRVFILFLDPVSFV